MAEYWDVVQWKESKNGKNFTVKLGSALKTDKGWTIFLNSLPFPNGKGECQIMIEPKREYGKPAPGTGRAESYRDAREGKPDEIPF